VSAPEGQERRRRIAVAITGATGAVFGVRLLQRLAAMDVETHLVISQWGRRTIEHETTHSVEQVRAMADVVHGIGDQGATLSSGSFRMDGMVVAPCSARTLAAIAHGLADNLITRAADVMLKERRQLVLMVREAPLNDIHLENMLKVSRAGAVVYPPVPAFYTRPETIDDIIEQTVGRVLDQFGLEQSSLRRWDGALGRREPRGRGVAATASGQQSHETAHAPAEAGHGGDAFADTFDRDRPLPEALPADEHPPVLEPGHAGDAFADTFDRDVAPGSEAPVRAGAEPAAAAAVGPGPDGVETAEPGHPVGASADPDDPVVPHVGDGVVRGPAHGREDDDAPEPGHGGDAFADTFDVASPATDAANPTVEDP
jgi:4-hydroxy-3-polyprenylbenzoate decarboxylase